MAFEFAYNNPKYADRVLCLLSRASDSTFERAFKRRRCSSTDTPLPAPQNDSEEIYVNSLLLGKDSVYFRRIFDGESFKESSEKVIDISLSSEEKEPFLDIIKYLYMNKLEADTVEKLLRVWHLSQRFLVESCGTLCLQRMVALPLSFESSCYFLDTAAVVNQTEELKQLVSKSIAFLANHFWGPLVGYAEVASRWKNPGDFDGLSASVLELLLASDKLEVIYEDSVYYAVKNWIKANCKDIQQELDAWRRFGPLIRWPMVELFRLKTLHEKLECNVLHDLLVEAFLYHASTDEERKFMETSATSNRFCRRVRHAVPLKCIALDSPVKHGIILFNFTMKEWNCLEKSKGPVYTERFTLASCVFIFMAKVRTSNRKRFSIFLVPWNPPASFRIHITMSTWSFRTNDYKVCHKGSHVVKKDIKKFKERIVMCHDCFTKDVDEIISDTEFVSEKSTLFKTEVQIYEAD